jgi:putative oxidoreductase
VDSIFALTQRASYPFLRIAMGVVLLWIGLVKFLDPSPVVGLLGASLSFLAFPAFAYLLGVVEVALALALFANVGTKYVGLALIGLFAGTLLIFLIAPKVVYAESGFPLLALPGEFLLKDLVLMAGAVTLVAAASARETARQTSLRLRPETA